MRARALAALWLAVAPVGAATARQPEARPALRADNVSTRLGRSLWRWTVFIDAPEDVLSRVRCVEYTLHPTFPDPVREVCARGDGPHAFPLTAKGWGVFRVGVQVVFEDGSTQQLVHRLHFDPP